MPADDLAGMALALLSAAVWGAGDFSGGAATRRSGPFQVLVLSALSGIAGLALVALLRGERLPTPGGALWAGLAGLAGGLALACLYRALAMGPSASVAPTSAVIGAALPVIFGIFTGGLPGVQRLAGFGLALAGIWLVSQGAAAGTEAQQAHARRAFLLACLAGLGFGAFFILIAQGEPDLVFTPLIVARGVIFAAALGLLRANRQALAGPASNPLALLAGLLDAGGNVLFLLARQFTRLDVAAVLSSMYPASTVLLSSLLFKEAISRRQWLGVALCLAAIGLIT
jgi:drug/metabolite transporter (DMT)-like permease